MPSRHPRIAVIADPELSRALERVRAATGSREPDATLVRRLAVRGAESQIATGHEHRAATAELFEALRAGRLELDPEAIDRLNAPPAVGA